MSTQFPDVVHVAEHPGYRVHRDGRIESDILRGSKDRRRTGCWAELKTYYNRKTGYLYVDLRSGAKRRNWAVHRLVARCFLAPGKEGEEVRHLDGNAMNNHATNLAWGTRSDNMQDAVRHGTIKRGERQENSKLTEDDVRRIRKRIACGESSSSIVREYGVSSSVISEIKTRKAWKHVD